VEGSGHCLILRHVRYLPGGNEKTTKSLSQDSWSPGRDLNPEPAEYEAGILTTGPRRLVSGTYMEYDCVLGSWTLLSGRYLQTFQRSLRLQSSEQ
jgi:hypothetical protein